MERVATRIVTTQIPKKRFISAQSSWFIKYILTACGLIRDCYIEEILSDWKINENSGKSYNEGPEERFVFDLGEVCDHLEDDHDRLDIKNPVGDDRYCY